MLFTTNSFACYCHLASRSRSNGRRAKNTSLDCLHIYLRPLVTDEDHVCQNCRGGPRAKTVTYTCTFDVLGAETATRYRRYVMITKPHSALLHSAIMPA